MCPERLTPDLAAVEAALKSSSPEPLGPARDRMLFLAGQASVRQAGFAILRLPSRWIWPCLTAASVLVAATLAGLLYVRGGIQVVERVVYVPDHQRDKTVESPARSLSVSPSAQSVPSAEYFRLCSRVLAQGLDALPELSGSGSNDIEIPVSGDLDGSWLALPDNG
jgi:hypothetical protein